MNSCGINQIKNKKQKIQLSEEGGMVYSTNADFEYDEAEILETPESSKQLLYLSIDKKQRKGKTVTLIEGFIGTADDLKQLAKQLKTLCGVGGSHKDGVILIQGDCLNKIKTFLTEKGYRTKGGR